MSQQGQQQPSNLGVKTAKRTLGRLLLRLSLEPGPRRPRHDLALVLDHVLALGDLHVSLAELSDNQNLVHDRKRIAQRFKRTSFSSFSSR
mgnify:CR=1 FL=1